METFSGSSSLVVIDNLKVGRFSDVDTVIKPITKISRGIL